MKLVKKIKIHKGVEIYKTSLKLISIFLFPETYCKTMLYISLPESKLE